jgi:hypothetical protein
MYFVTSALRVAAAGLPSTGSPFACWKALSAAVVLASRTPGEEPS